jgi:hypothetical protein
MTYKGKVGELVLLAIFNTCGIRGACNNEYKMTRPLRCRFKTLFQYLRRDIAV